MSWEKSFGVVAILAMVRGVASASEATPEAEEASKAPAAGNPSETDLASKEGALPASSEHLSSPPFVARLGPTYGEQAEGYAERSIGLRGAFSDSADGVSAAIVERGAAWLAGDVLTARYADELFLGHSERDIVYRAALQATIGLRWSSSSGGGPFVRTGLGLGIEQDGGLRLATVRLPMVEVGYQFAKAGRLVDLALSAAPLLTGYFDGHGLSVPLGGASFGGTAAMVLPPALFALDTTLLQAGDGGFLTEGRSRVCWLANFVAPTALHRTGDPRRPLVVGPAAREARFSLCAFGRVTSFAALDAYNGGGSPAFGAGLTLSFGTHSLLDPAPRVF